MNAEENNLHRRHKLWRILDWIDYIIIGVMLLTVLLLAGVTWWLTPSRLSEIVDRQASKELNADVRTGNIAFTFWTTFPHFCIVADSLHIRSRNLDSIPGEIKAQLPSNSDFLLSTGRVVGGINIAKLLKGQIWLRDVTVDSLRLNFVAVNDTLNNYNIVPSSGKTKIPYFNIDKMKFVNGGDVRFYSHLSKTDAKISLSDASLMPQGTIDNYHLKFKGNLFASSGGFRLFKSFPFELDGDINFHFKPFGITARDYTVNFGKVKGKVGLDLDMGNDVRLNDFDYHLIDFSLDDIKMMLPDAYRNILKKFDADLQLEASARLTSPYNFSSGFFPSVEVDFMVPDGEVGYTFNDNERYSVRNIGLAGKLVFNGVNPELSYLEIPEFKVKGYGAQLTASAVMSHFTDSPRIDVHLNGQGNLDEALTKVPELKPLGLTGNIDFKISTGFNIVGNSIRSADFKADVNSDALGLSLNGYNVSLKDFHASTDEKYSDNLTWQSTVNNIPFEIKLSSSKASVNDKNHAFSLNADGLKGDAKLGVYQSAKGKRSVNLTLSGADLDLSSNNFKTNLKNVSLSLDASYLDSLLKVRTFTTPSLWKADIESTSRISHTPEYVRINLPINIKNLMARWKMALNLKSSGGAMDINNYLLNVSDLDLSASFDSIALHNVSLSHGDTRGNLSADITNLRQFLNSNVPAPLYIKADVNLDTVQVNQLAHDFVASHPKSPAATGDKKEMGTGVDTVAIILPRNIYADIFATAKQTRYTNLHLYDLMTKMKMADGKVNIDTLYISSDFGKLGANLIYDTSDMQNMNVMAGFRFYDVNLTGFFSNFHKLLLMWPEMKNLSGDLSMALKAKTHIFPNMYLNPPSLWANINIDGWNLQLHQNDFIRHLAHMLLIHQDEPIDIENVNFHAVIHSNLLELFPTTFEVSKYKLILMGLNNFNGDLYYHLGVEKWPLGIPFGVNIKGNYHHPIMRFGGKEWKDKNGALITSGVQDAMNFNVVHEVRKFAAEFIHSAATYKESEN